MNPTSTPASIALLIAAPASGCGKTSIVAGLARLYARQGRRVAVFKCGPDFLDPQIHATASGQPCQNIDLWMCGEADASTRLSRAAREAEVILVEGVMGLFDGAPSAADIARRFQIPVLAVIDAGAMAQTFGAVAHGLADYRQDLSFVGVLANRVAGPGHAAMLASSLKAGMRWCGAVPHDPDAVLPERHLGLHISSEIEDLNGRLERMADHLAQTPLADPTVFPAWAGANPAIAPSAQKPGLAGTRIAIARDAAFSFIYPANLEILEQLGARLSYFSPLAGELLPDCDAVWLPGGYPELHAARLSKQFGPDGILYKQLYSHWLHDKVIVAECGGMMVLFEQLVDLHGDTHPMAGLIPGRVTMQARPVAIGGQEVALPEGTIRGHTFHCSQSTTPLAPLALARPQSAEFSGNCGEAIYRRKRLTASYLHFYLPSNPRFAVNLFASPRYP